MDMIFNHSIRKANNAHTERNAGKVGTSSCGLCFNFSFLKFECWGPTRVFLLRRFITDLSLFSFEPCLMRTCSV